MDSVDEEISKLVRHAENAVCRLNVFGESVELQFVMWQHDQYAHMLHHHDHPAVTLKRTGITGTDPIGPGAGCRVGQTGTNECVLVKDSKRLYLRRRKGTW